MEYGFEYAVYATPSGLTYSLNESIISIMDILSMDDFTIAEISELSGIPTSAVRSSLKRAIKDDLVEVYTKDDRRIEYYRSISRKLCCNLPLDLKKDEERHMSAWIDSIGPAAYARAGYQIMVVHAVAVACNIDMSPAMNNFAAEKATKMFNSKKYKNSEEMLAFINQKCKTDLLARVYVEEDGDKVRIYSTDSENAPNILSAVWPIITYVATSFTLLNGTPYGVCEIIGDEHLIHEVQIKPLKDMSKPLRIIPTHAVPYDVDSIQTFSPFNIFTQKDKSLLVANEAMLYVLQNLEIKNQTMAELTADFQGSDSTLYGNLKKLLHSGIIEEEIHPLQSTIYRSKAMSVFREQIIDDVNIYYPDYLDVSEELTLYEYEFNSLWNLMRTYSVNFLYVAVTVGRWYYQTSMREKYADLSLNELVQLECEKLSSDEYNISVKPGIMPCLVLEDRGVGIHKFCLNLCETIGVLHELFYDKEKVHISYKVESLSETKITLTIYIEDVSNNPARFSLFDYRGLIDLKAE